VSPVRNSARGGSGRTLHRTLIAAEAVLVLGVVKDWGWRHVLDSSLANWGKVALAMLLTIGLFGGFYVVLQRFLARGVSRTHQAAGVLPVFWPTLIVHAALLFVLFLLYARILKLTVLPG